jgi:predicted nucleotidyltransferase
VSVLDALGCVDMMSFGSESSDAAELVETAAVLLDPAIDALIRDELSHGASYAAARQRAAEKLAGKKLPALARPNDILGIEYIKAMRRLGSSMEPLALLREGAHDADDAVFPSASVLRVRLRRGESVDGMTPPACAEIIKAEVASGREPVSPEALETAALAVLRRMELNDFLALPDAGDGLAERMLKAASKARTLEELYELTKTRRLAMSRIRRAAMCALLGVTAESRAAAPGYIRVLAANEKGRAVLKKKTRRLPLITKAASAKKLEGAALREFLLDVRASDLRSLGRPAPEARIAGEDWLTSPYMA